MSHCWTITHYTGIATTTLQTWATKSSPLIWLYFKEGHNSLGNGESLKSAAGAWVQRP